MTILSFLTAFFFQTGIYAFTMPAIDGGAIRFSEFTNKKILIVNIATDSKFSSQISSLEQLYQRYKDSLVIIAVPTNDFKHESRTDSSINVFLKAQYHISYLVASTNSVIGAKRSSLYQWLCKGKQNGYADNDVPGDFSKYLIDSQGKLIGVFSGPVDPMDEDIQNTIKNN
jgi:glutathione peroxidase